MGIERPWEIGHFNLELEEKWSSGLPVKQRALKQVAYIIQKGQSKLPGQVSLQKIYATRSFVEKLGFRSQWSILHA